MPEIPSPKPRAHPKNIAGASLVLKPARRSATSLHCVEARGVPYAELGVTSNFSFLRGASHPDELVMRAAELGYEGVAIADWHTLAGVVRAHTALKNLRAEATDTDAIPKLIVGARVVCRDVPDNEGRARSMCLYPTDRASYARLSRLLTLGKRRAPKGECHLTHADICEHASGLLAVADAGSPEGLQSWLATLREVFDDDRLSLGVSRLYHQDDDERLQRLGNAAADAGVALVATNDVVYATPDRRALLDVLTCVRLGMTVEQAGTLLGVNAERYMKPPVEMARLFASMPGAVERSVRVARRATFSLDELRYEYPREVCPEGWTPDRYLRALALRGAMERFSREPARRTGREAFDAAFSGVRLADASSIVEPGPEEIVTVPPEVRARLEHEFALIEELGYAKYFLTVFDIVRFARSRGILCQGRGAAANSTVCFCLGITSVDPQRVDMLFERFVSRERNEPPDIDIDFEHERREEVIQYIYARFGRERAALVAEVISYRGRSAVRDVGKALGLAPDLVEQLARSLEWWDRGVVGDDRLREMGMDPADPTLRRLLALCEQLLGFPRHLSQHVGGFVITQGRLDEIVPIENAAMADRTVIEWDKDDVDAMGMLKIDCLGLGMLTCLARAMKMVAPGIDPPDMAWIPPEDPAVYDMICEADTLGVFQIESRAQMSMLPRLRPRCYYDLVIEVAIVRPGPIQGDMVHPYLRRRRGEEPVTYAHPSVEKVLRRTLGVPLFQEQCMQLAVEAAGFTPGEADALRRAMAAWKRRGNLIVRFGERLVDGMVARGIPREFAARCFEQIKGFSEYGFPESHAASFALLVYASCWLKRHHPAAFAAALLNSQPMGFYQPSQIITDAQEHGVRVLPVDIRQSAWDCTLETPPQAGSVGTCGGADGSHPSRPVRAGRGWGSAGPAIRLGLRLVQGLGERDARAIERVRTRHAWVTLAQVRRESGVSVRCMRALAAADAFASLGLSRREALWQILSMRDAPLPLFDGANDGPADGLAAEAGGEPESAASTELPAMSQLDQVVRDYEATGLSLRAHPLAFARRGLSDRGVRPLRDLHDEQAAGTGSRIAVAGVVLVRQRPSTASGVVFFTIEDETGVGNLIVRPTVYERYRRLARHSSVVVASGRVERSQGVVHLLVERFDSADAAPKGARARDFR